MPTISPAAVAVAFLLAPLPQAPTPPPATSQSAASQPAQDSPAYVPERVYDTRSRAFGDFESMLASLARVDVVIVGEQHDDPNTHRLELAVLQGLRRRKVSVQVSLEMFERDVQPAVDAYLAGGSSEAQFRDTSRPWPRYATDYRPLVELGKESGWPVVAANVPRKYAASIAKSGMSALGGLAPDERVLIAADLQCPLDGYFDRFVKTMGEHPGSNGATADPDQRGIVERYYQSQCAKDETMAEAIATAVSRRSTGSVLVHFTGAFHADFGTGTVERVRRRLPASHIAVVSMIPKEDLDALAPAGDDLTRADYLVFTVGKS
jgi:uncharacterized iron-regulated protein